ncbi:MAG TPA: hypothetical protein VKH37_08965, partial [Ferruginibacter sp.]|nr:hypothetical protein [Ferruginibacter sp.]
MTVIATIMAEVVVATTTIVKISAEETLVATGTIAGAAAAAATEIEAAATGTTTGILRRDTKPYQQGNQELMTWCPEHQVFLFTFATLSGVEKRVVSG